MQKKIIRELWYEYSHSSGAGGQHINRNLTRAVACFSIDKSGCYTPSQKALLKRQLGSRVSKDGILRVGDQSSRSQVRNKLAAADKLVRLLQISLVRRKVRKITKATLASKKRRLVQKKKQS